MIKRAMVVLPVLVCLSGCLKEFKDQFKDLFQLRDDIIKEFDVENVKVVIQNDSCIGVSFINTKYNDESEARQEEVRQKTLELIDANYPKDGKITKAWISFMKHKRYIFGFNVTNAMNTQSYERTQDGSWKKTR